MPEIDKLKLTWNEFQTIVADYKSDCLLGS